MSYWSHNPEVLDEITRKEFLCRIDDAPGECIINFNYADGGEIDYYWLIKKFGEDFALSIMVEAEQNYWDGFCE